VLGAKPEVEYEYDDRTEKDIPKKPSRKDYPDFIYEKIDSNETNYKQIKDYSIRHKVIPPSFFGEDSDIVGNTNDFENIINSIHRGFDPEKITGEEHFQSQLAIFLKAKFPDKKVEREVRTKMGNDMDIVVDDKYVFELKVPKSRAELRNLSAQLEEYVEEYPNICAVIADTSKIDEEVESDLTQNIKQYSDKYKVKFHIQTLIFEIGKRK